VAVASGQDVKKSELHGMSQRGGSVSSDVRFGQRIFSPMVTEGEADFLVVVAADQIEVNRFMLAPGGVLIDPSQIDVTKLSTPKSLNVALLGALSKHLPFADEAWRAALERNLPEKLHEANFKSFSIGQGR
jgi:indolepyruvate ferredoxin oxidoreductase beta subunit